jgi:GNAT superfamily N-acetyltransferase
MEANMNDLRTRAERFLEDTAPHLLEAAVAWNHRKYFVLQTRALHGKIRQADGVTWTSPGYEYAPMILFPELDPQRAGEQLDTIIQFYREHPPNQLVGCWSLLPTQPVDLDIRLLARGFQLGWQPCWMWVELERMQHHTAPAGLRIELLEAAPTWDAPRLPYYSREDAGVSLAMAALPPRQIWHVVAWLDGEPVGHSTLCLTRGSLGIAGIYGVGVVPEARNRGVGKAVVAAVCRLGRDLGARIAMLNGTGERMYRQLGFERLGYGQTWWLNVMRLVMHWPSQQRIALAEAVGRGDLSALAALARQGWDAPLDQPLTNEMTLLELAAHAQQPNSAEWLIGQGVALDLLPAWDLGWKDRVVHLLEAHPELANRRSGEMGTTPLHTAVERNDLELARVLLAARPDLESRDSRFGGTPLGWARHLQRTELIALIEGASS